MSPSPTKMSIIPAKTAKLPDFGEGCGLFGGGDMEHEILRTGTDADFRAPDAEPGRDVVAGLPALMAAPGFFKEGIRDPGGGPDLALVRVAAELEIDSGGFRFFQMIRLVIKQDSEDACVSDKFCQRFASCICAVVPADDPDGSYVGTFIPEDLDARLLEEAHCAILVTIILVISQHGKHRRLDAPQFFRTLYEAFEPADARRIWEKLELHHTPEAWFPAGHGRDRTVRLHQGVPGKTNWRHRGAESRSRCLVSGQESSSERDRLAVLHWGRKSQAQVFVPGD